MESKLDEILDNMMQNDNTIGAIVSDAQGLSFGTRGVASSNAAGLITAIIDQACKLHPNSNAPCVILENNELEVSIAKFGNVNGAVYKEKPSAKK